MLRLLTSIVLCLVAQLAAAQGASATTPLVAQVHPSTGLIRTTGAATPDAAQRPKAAGGELIKTAAAGPREVAMRQSATASGPPQSQAADEEHPRRTGPAMLIAALAAMTAIALRRSGGSRL